MAAGGVGAAGGGSATGITDAFCPRRWAASQRALCPFSMCLSMRGAVAHLWAAFVCDIFVVGIRVKGPCRHSGGGYSFVACLDHLTIDHASLSRRGGGGLTNPGGKVDTFFRVCVLHHQGVFLR